MSEWELSKENIQPLRGGRRAAIVAGAGPDEVATPLRHNSEIQQDIAKQKERFECDLRSCWSQSDPVDPWHRYLGWVEQTFPRGGREANLRNLIEKFIKEFKDRAPWNEDQRYLEAWIKYADMSQKPLDIFNFMYTNKICQTLPEFYVNWSWELEQMGNFKKAAEIFQRGLESVAQSEERLEYLKRKEELFQARVAAKICKQTNDDVFYQDGEEERAVLGELRGRGKTQIVGSLRIGAAKKSHGPGVLSTAPPPQKVNTTKPKFGIFQDENAHPSSLPEPKSSSTADVNLPFRHKQNRENELAPGKWNSATIGKKSHAVHLNEISSKPTFSIHQDEGLLQPTPSKHTVELSEHKALSSKKPDESADYVPLAIFEPSDPTKMVMYCKDMVYQGTTEFSFEELRAMKIRKANENVKTQVEKEAMNQVAEEWQAKEEALNRRQADLARKQEEMEREMAQVLLEQEEQMKKMQEEYMRSMEEEEKIKNNKIPDAVPFPVFKDDSYGQTTQSSRLESSNIKTNETMEATKQRRKQPLQERVSSQPPSPTVNTKEALNLVSQMWSESQVEKEEEQIEETFSLRKPIIDENNAGSKLKKPTNTIGPRKPMLGVRKPQFSLMANENSDEEDCDDMTGCVKEMMDKFKSDMRKSTHHRASVCPVPELKISRVKDDSVSQGRHQRSFKSSFMQDSLRESTSFMDTQDVNKSTVRGGATSLLEASGFSNMPKDSFLGLEESNINLQEESF